MKPTLNLQQQGEQLAYSPIEGEHWINDPIVKFPTPSKHAHLLQELVQIIHQHLEDSPSLSITFLARSLAMSRSTLHRKLKESTGRSVTEYISWYRMQIAARLLCEAPYLSISEIAFKVGFEDQAYFSNCFKKVFKTCPSHYRKTINEN